MKLKRILSAALAACLCASLWVGGTPARAAGTLPPAFTDISDGTQAESAELLRLLGVVAGDGAGHFSPNDQLTRAEFCAMVIGVRNESEQAKAMMNYTFYKDVKGDHWARGFINYASRITVGDSGERLVSGVGDASFAPDRGIEFAEAVTMVVRLLGYSQKDVPIGAHWYDGYMTVGRTVGLLTALELGPEAYLTRGQAAILFQNMLFASAKGSDQPYFTVLGGGKTGEVVILSTNATAADGTTGCVEVTDGSQTTVYKTDHAAFSASLQGAKVELMLDADRKVVAVRPVTTVSRRVVTLSAHEATYITTAAGERLPISGTATFYRGSERTTYGNIYMDLKSGSQLTLVYGITGQLEYAYLPTGADTTYDVVTRLTAVYQDASPSPKTPLTIRVLNENLTVLDSAVEELAAFKPGDHITLMLTADGKVAGARAAGSAGSTLVGVVIAGSADSATVKPVLGLKDASGAELTFTGSVSSSAEKLEGELVTVSSSNSNSLTLTKVSGSGAKSALNVQNHTLGGEALADRVYLYERTAGGTPKAISWSQITVDTVPASKISYAGTDESGKVNVLVLGDVTGDGYSYGYLSPRTEERTIPATGGLPETSYNEYYIDLKSDGATTSVRVRFSSGLRYDTPGGVAQGVNDLGSYVTLTEVKRVQRSSFNTEAMTVTISGVSYPIASNVVCYNKTTGVWFGSGAEGLAAARAYGENLSVYYDKTPAEGGKIRMVVVG